MLSYKEQLLHPNWQRKRLEVMEAAGFKCQVCEAKDKQLNVHHRRYVRGRLAWEYDAAELDCLCQRCHDEAHDIKAMLEELVATSSGGDSRLYALGLMAGYLEADYSITGEQFERAAGLSGHWLAECGVAASAFAAAGIEEQLQALLVLTAGKPTGPVVEAVIADLEGRVASYHAQLAKWNTQA